MFWGYDQLLIQCANIVVLFIDLLEFARFTEESSYLPVNAGSQFPNFVPFVLASICLMKRGMIPSALCIILGLIPSDC